MTEPSPATDRGAAAAVATALARVPALDGLSPGQVHATPLPSLTNRVFALDAPGLALVLRLPGPAAGVDRATELVHHRLAADLGLAPAVVHADPRDGLLVTVRVRGGRALAAADLTDHAVRGRVARALAALHHSRAPFVGPVTAAGALARYRQRLAALGVALPSGTAATCDRVAAACARLEALPVARVPSHNDPAPANLLDTGGQIVLVDWEYAGIADPLWDVATVADEAELDAAGAWALLVAYLGRSPAHGEAARLLVLMAGLDVLGGLWGLVQSALGNTAVDFAAYAHRRLARGAAWSASGALDQAVAGLTAGTATTMAGRPEWPR